MKYRLLASCLALIILAACGPRLASHGNAGNPFQVIAYYSGNADNINQYPVEKLSQIIYSFCHLRGNKLAVDNAADSATIRQLVVLKERNPSMRVILSLGGWGGCATCSPVFSTAAARQEFAASVKELSDYFKTDGIDLDWEYPAIEGYPGHAFTPADKDNFTALVRALRGSLGSKAVISFAAGGFDKFLDSSIDWKAIEPLVNNVNLMSYDLVSGFSTVTGHHTPLYSNATQKASAHHAIQRLAGMGFPKNKIVIGCGFYARTWVGVANTNHGLYQGGTFKNFVDHKRMQQHITTEAGYQFFWDDTAQAMHAYNSATQTFATFDEARSVAAKTRYAREQGLHGIMFWELNTDKPKDGLLDVIANTLAGKN